MKITKTIAEWRSLLTPLQFKVLREKATEPPHSGVFNNHRQPGTYLCAGCSQPLFSSTAKFDSHCGWPSFDRSIEKSVEMVEDRSFNMKRTEVVCSQCGGHLGHVFDDGPTETGTRFCINSASLDFTQKQ